MADVIIGMFSIPFQFQAAVLQRWDLPKFMCPFCPFIQTLSVNVSIFTLTAIAIDRHKAILNPLRARSSKHASKIIIAIIWIVAFLLAAPISYALRVVDLTHYIISKYFRKLILAFLPHIHLSILKIYKHYLYMLDAQALHIYTLRPTKKGMNMENESKILKSKHLEH